MYCNKLDKIGLKYSYTLKYIKSDGDMEHTNGNIIITERPVRNYNIHVPRLQSCPFTGQTRLWKCSLQPHMLCAQSGFKPRRSHNCFFSEDTKLSLSTTSLIDRGRLFHILYVLIKNCV